MARNETSASPVVLDYTQDLSLEERVGQIRGMTNILLPRETRLEGEYDSYAVVFGNYPLRKRRISEIQPFLEQALL